MRPRAKQFTVAALAVAIGTPLVEAQTSPRGRWIATWTASMFPVPARNLLHVTGPGDVAGRYDGLVDLLVIDESDAPATAEVELVVANAVMRDVESERRLAEAVLEAACA